jgi:hypothetical protein
MPSYFFFRKSQAAFLLLLQGDENVPASSPSNGRLTVPPHIRYQEGASRRDPTQTSDLLRYSFVSIAGVIKLCP